MCDLYLFVLSWMSIIFSTYCYFFDKWNMKYINNMEIPLHSTFATTQYPNGSTDAHCQKKRKKKLRNKSPDTEF
jgi:hypothetical protein